MSAPKLAIVILSYNTEKLTKNCLSSLSKAFKNAKNKPVIWVVDNHSKDSSRQMLEKQKKSYSKLELVFNNRNFGFAKGNNIGIKKAILHGAEYILILNSDTEVKDDFYQPLLDWLLKNPQAGVVTPKIYFAPGYEYHKERYKKSDKGKVIWAAGGENDWQNIYGKNRGVNQVDCGQFDKPAEVDFASGCCFLASAKTWQEARFFDEKYFMYYEDNDFCQRVKKLGKKIYYLPISKIWHLNSGSSRVGGDLQDYFIIRNRLLFGFRWASIRTKLALAREAMRLFFRGRKWQKIAVRDYLLKNFGMGSWQSASV